MTSDTSSRKQLEDLAGGLFLMILFTTIWIFIAEVNLAGRDHWAVGLAFAVIIVYFIIKYYKINRASKTLNEGPVVDDSVEKARDKRFYIIVAIEGIAIFIMQTVLLNIGHKNLFFPIFALIVGLHFIPLARLYNRWFYYLIAAWICLVAITGFVLACKANIANYMPIVIIGIGCAGGTAMNGFRIIRESHLLLMGCY